MHRPQNSARLVAELQYLLARCGFVLFLPAFLVLAPLSFAADSTNAAGAPTVVMVETNPTPDLVRAYLQLQEQLHEAQLAIERNRQEAQTAATRQTEAIAARLQALEEALVAQRTQEAETRAREAETRAQELDAIRSSNRLMITLGGTFAVAAFLAILLTAYFQWRVVSRLTEFSVLSQGSSLTAGRSPALAVGAGTPDMPVVAGALTEQTNNRLLGALERLEKRILELEHTARPSLGNVDAAAESAGANSTDHVSLLLAKGESLLSLDKTEEALACYDEILASDPNHSEALVKKGDTLERLRKIGDAIDCYDRAIAAGGSLTVAYLHKGGLFNRLERYEEALQCYEQALRTQEKNQSHAA